MLSHVYIHRASIGEVAAATAVQTAMWPILDAMCDRGELQGAGLHLLEDREAAENELLHHMFDFEAMTDARYPFVHAWLTPVDTDASKAAADALMAAHGFERCK